VAVDRPNRVVYVSDFRGNRVERFGLQGSYLTQWGGLGTAHGQFSGASGLAVDPAGNIYVGDQANGRIQVFAPR
jgi:DNA-binding beta-propeller fold protein YncE